MKPITRTIFAGMLAVGVFMVALATGWLTADAGPPQQQSAEAPASATKEPLPDFQPTEELPADSAVAFPTDI
jgi:hypothetical protein